MAGMATGLTWRRIAGSPNALALAGAPPSVAAFGQAMVQGLTHTVNASDPGSAPEVIALCLLALAGTLPLIFLRPVAAAVTITATSALVLAVFGTPTVAAMVAQVIASYRLRGPARPAVACARPGGAVRGARAGVARRGGHRPARLAGPDRGRRRDRAAGQDR